MDGRKEEMIEGGKECETKVGRRKEAGRKELQCVFSKPPNPLIYVEKVNLFSHWVSGG